MREGHPLCKSCIHAWADASGCWRARGTDASLPARRYVALNATTNRPTDVRYDWKADSDAAADYVSVSFASDPRLATAAIPLVFYIGVHGG